MTATSPARNRVLATATVPLLLAATLTAQCGRQWEALSAIPGTNQPVFDVTTWDPDGAGPAPTVLVAGGPFWRAGAGDARSVATFDFVAGAWNALDTGLDPFSGVRAVASSPAGELVIAGELRVSGLPGSQLERVARWNGTSWDVLGTFDGNVDCVELLPSGDVVAGGLFATVNGQAAPGLARWDGTSWSAIPGFAALYVGDLLVLPNGDLLVAAYLGFASHALQLWNGVSWTTIGQPNEFVNSMAVLPGGDVVVGGSFTAIDVLQVARVARWNGTTWSALGAGITSANAIVWHVTGLPNGNVIAGGSFQAAGSVAVADIARFDGTNWSDMNGGTGGSFGGTVYGLVALPNGDAIAAGSFLRAGGVAAARVARWSPTGWSSLGEGFTASVIDLAEQGGDLVAAGVFAIAGVPGADNIAVRRAGGWQALGTGTDGRVRCVLPRAGGRLVAGGAFATAGGVSASRIAEWDGTSWSALGPGLGGEVHALLTLANGDLLAGGDFPARVARWNGATWSPFGTPPGRVRALARMPNGDLVAGGWWLGGIVRWNGTAWQPMGAGFDARVESLVVLPDGDLVAGGFFATSGTTALNYVARWDGAAWQPIGGGRPGPVIDVAVGPDGRLVTANLAGAQGQIARWDGAAWSALANLTDLAVNALLATATGELVAGGDFQVIDGVPAQAIAELASSCPASVATGNNGCVGASGPVALAATSLPWVGASFDTVATGLPPNALGIGLRGLTTQSTPWSTLVPQGLPGCTLLVTPDMVRFVLPNGGSVAESFAVPATPALAGAVFYQQLTSIELSASGAISAIAASNSLAVTLGLF